MNNYCRHCGEKLEKDVKTCPKCSAPVFEKRINITQKKKELEEYKKKEAKYVIAIVLLYVSSFLMIHFSSVEKLKFLSSTGPLIFLVATILLIYARIVMNESRKIRVLFAIFISLIILYILFVIFIFMTCTIIINKGCH